MCFITFHHRNLIQHWDYLFTWFDIQFYFSVDILSGLGHPTPVFTSIRRTEIRDSCCEDSFIVVIMDGVFAFLSLCGPNKNITIVLTVIPAQVFLIRLITLFIGAKNFSFSPLVSRHTDQPCCTGDLTQSNCKEKSWHVKKKQLLLCVFQGCSWFLKWGLHTFLSICHWTFESVFMC